MKFEREVNLKCLIGQFQRGFKTISGSSLISSVAALLGIAGGFVLALKGSKIGILNTLHLEWLPNTQTSSPKQLPLALASCSYFQPFLQNVLEEYEFSRFQDRVDGFPLTIALAALLEDLSVVGGGRVVLSPQKLMLAMEAYIQNFNLTSQQDAAEAFPHLPSSLREELSDCYLPLIVGLLLQREWRTRVSRQDGSNTTLGHLMEFSVASSRVEVAQHRYN